MVLSFFSFLFIFVKLFLQRPCAHVFNANCTIKCVCSFANVPFFDAFYTHIQFALSFTLKFPRCILNANVVNYLPLSLSYG
jgi:hypothetical protein